MRYFCAFLVGFGLLALLVFGIAGRRGTDFRKPPIEIFDDMVRQAKLRPQVPNGFFADGREIGVGKLTSEIAKHYLAIVHGETADHDGWLTGV